VPRTFPAFCLLLSGCIGVSQTAQAANVVDFNTAAQSAISSTASFYSELDNLERVEYLRQLRLFPEMPLSTTLDVNPIDRNVPMVAVRTGLANRYSDRQIQARLRVIDGIARYSSGLASLASSTAPTDASTAISSLSQPLSDISAQLKTLATDDGDKRLATDFTDVKNLTGPMVDLASILGKLVVSATQTADIASALKTARPYIEGSCTLLEDDLYALYLEYEGQIAASSAFADCSYNDSVVNSILKQSLSSPDLQQDKTKADTDVAALTAVAGAGTDKIPVEAAAAVKKSYDDAGTALTALIGSPTDQTLATNAMHKLASASKLALKTAITYDKVAQADTAAQSINTLAKDALALASTSADLTTTNLKTAQEDVALTRQLLAQLRRTRIDKLIGDLRIVHDDLESAVNSNILTGRKGIPSIRILEVTEPSGAMKRRLFFSTSKPGQTQSDYERVLAEHANEFTTEASTVGSNLSNLLKLSEGTDANQSSVQVEVSVDPVVGTNGSTEADGTSDSKGTAPVKQKKRAGWFKHKTSEKIAVVTDDSVQLAALQTKTNDSTTKRATLENIHRAAMECLGECSDMRHNSQERKELFAKGIKINACLSNLISKSFSTTTIEFKREGSELKPLFDKVNDDLTALQREVAAVQSAVVLSHAADDVITAIAALSNKVP